MSGTTCAGPAVDTRPSTVFASRVGRLGRGSDRAREGRKGGPVSVSRSSDPWRLRLREERGDLGLTQAELGLAAGVSAETVRKYESGARTPTREHLAALLRALQVPQARAREILRGAGFASADTLFPADAYPAYYFTAEEAAAEVQAAPWPQFVVNDAQEIVAANRAAELLLGVDLAVELASRGRAQLHFLSLVAEPRFSGRIANFEECLAMVVGALKGVPAGGPAIDAPGPWAEQVLARVAAMNPGALATLLRVWERTPPRPARSRWTYPLVWREPEGDIRFTGLVTTASEPDGLAFSDWLPSDAASHLLLEQVLDRAAMRPDTHGVRSGRRPGRERKRQ
jgi:transcriptional regulator with XRE-family HTH domain